MLTPAGDLQLLDERVRPRLRAVGDHELRGSGREQRADDPAGRPARAEHEDAAAGQRHMLIRREVADQADPVCVVAAQPAGDEADRVDGAGRVDGLAALVDERKRGFFVRHGHVHALAARGREAAHCRLEVLGLGVDRLVRELLLRLAREQRVDQRRAAVVDGMPDHGIAIERRNILGHLRDFTSLRFCTDFGTFITGRHGK